MLSLSISESPDRSATAALAPSDTNTVENPSTNKAGGNHRLALDARLGFMIGETFQRRAGQVHQIRRHQRQHARGEK